MDNVDGGAHKRCTFCIEGYLSRALLKRHNYKLNTSDKEVTVIKIFQALLCKHSEECHALVVLRYRRGKGGAEMIFKYFAGYLELKAHSIGGDVSGGAVKILRGNKDSRRGVSLKARAVYRYLTVKWLVCQNFVIFVSVNGIRKDIIVGKRYVIKI